MIALLKKWLFEVEEEQSAQDTKQQHNSGNSSREESKLRRQGEAMNQLKYDLAQINKAVQQAQQGTPIEDAFTTLENDRRMSKPVDPEMFQRLVKNTRRS